MPDLKDLSPSISAERWLPALRLVAWLMLGGVTFWLAWSEARRSALPNGVLVERDIVYRRVGSRRARLDVYTPSGKAPADGRPAIVAIHGGGWQGGSKLSYGRMAARLAEHGFVVISPDYVLSYPGSPSWPENLEDLREAVRWVRRNARAYGVDSRRIVALGASAGGHLAALLGTDPFAGPESVSSRVSAVVDFYGPTDLKALAASGSRPAGPLRLLIGAGCDELPDRYDAASPITHVSPDDPPTLIFHGTDDALVPVAQSRALANALDAAGVRNRLVVIEHARHGFELRVDRERDLVPEIISFLDDSWNEKRAQAHALMQDDIRSGPRRP